MSSNAAKPVLLWAAFNAVLLAIIVGYGGTWFDYGLTSGAVTIVLLWALAVLAGRRRHGVPVRRYRVVGASGAPLALALACLFGGLAVIFGFWFVPIVFFPLLPPVLLTARRRSGPERVGEQSRAD